MFQYDYDDDDDDDDNDDDNVVGWRQGAVQKTSPQGVPRTSATPHFHDHLLLINWAHYEDDDVCGDDGERGDSEDDVMFYFQISKLCCQVKSRAIKELQSASLLPHCVHCALCTMCKQLPPKYCCAVVDRPTQLICISDIYLLSWRWRPPWSLGTLYQWSLQPKKAS